MKILLEYIFDWLPFGIGAPIFIGLGFTLLADEFKAFTAARVFFYLAATWILGKVFMWAYFTSNEFRIRAVIAFLIFGCVGVGLIEALRLTNRREVRNSLSPESPGQPSNSSSESLPILLVQRRVLSGLPIQVKAGSTIYVLQLIPGIQHGLYTHSVNGKEGEDWPPRHSWINKYQYMDSISEYEFTNHSVALFNVELTFPTEYHEPMLIAAKVTAKPDKSFHLELGLKGTGITSGMVAVRQVGKKAFQGYAPGEMLHSAQRVVSLPEIPMDSRVSIYVVNQSQLVAVCGMPTVASGEVAGTGVKTQVKLTYASPSGIGVETIPQTFAPAAYPWPGPPRN